jgi:hypothetical protein
MRGKVADEVDIDPLDSLCWTVTHIHAGGEGGNTMSTNCFRFRVGAPLLLGLIWTSAALGQGPLFGPAVHYAAGVGPKCVAIGDLDGDQVPDLAVANWYGDNVSVLLNQRGCAGDLNGDGDTDLADLGILLADFGCPAPGNPAPCEGDLDNDGDTDLADLGILLADFGCGT